MRLLWGGCGCGRSSQRRPPRFWQEPQKEALRPGGAGGGRPGGGGSGTGLDSAEPGEPGPPQQVGGALEEERGCALRPGWGLVFAAEVGWGTPWRDWERRLSLQGAGTELGPPELGGGGQGGACQSPHWNLSGLRWESVVPASPFWGPSLCQLRAPLRPAGVAMWSSRGRGPAPVLQSPPPLPDGFLASTLPGEAMLCVKLSQTRPHVPWRRGRSWCRKKPSRWRLLIRPRPAPGTLASEKWVSPWPPQGQASEVATRKGCSSWTVT